LPEAAFGCHGIPQVKKPRKSQFRSKEKLKKNQLEKDCSKLNLSSDAPKNLRKPPFFCKIWEYFFRFCRISQPPENVVYSITATCVFFAWNKAYHTGLQLKNHKKIGRKRWPRKIFFSRYAFISR
jgi:hypothetical protein